MRRACVLVIALVVLAAAPSAGMVPAGTPDAVNIVKARRKKVEPAFTWVSWEPASFARARREKKIVLVDGAAEWCHWCHVMDETTYRDPRVGAWLAANAIAIKVDIDQRPDLANRYGDWGWPATILLTGDGAELGKFRGYLEPERLLGILRALDVKKPMEQKPEVAGVGVAQLPSAVAHALERLDFFWDETEGSWGLRRKVPIGMNIVWELTRGTPESIARADLTLTKQRALIDPVWGGIYQYSAAANWSAPHFEKLITYQAPNLEAAARGFLVTRRPEHLADARALYRYLVERLRSPEGTFFVNQDADVNAHDRSKPFVDGHVFYALDDAHRTALGSPWVDTHVYAAENGKAILALLAFHQASGAGLDDAQRAARVIAKTHVLPSGAVKHEATSSEKGPFFLDDAAALGLAFARLAEATKDPLFDELSRRVMAFLERSFAGDGPLFFDVTEDGDAVGVFARRVRSFGPNVTAARLSAALGGSARARTVLAGLSGTPRLDDEFAWLGDYLVACREAGVVIP